MVGDVDGDRLERLDGFGQMGGSHPGVHEDFGRGGGEDARAPEVVTDDRQASLGGLDPVAIPGAEVQPPLKIFGRLGDGSQALFEAPGQARQRGQFRFVEFELQGVQGRLGQIVRLVDDEVVVLAEHGHPTARGSLEERILEDDRVVRDDDPGLLRGSPRSVVETLVVAIAEPGRADGWSGDAGPGSADLPALEIHELAVLALDPQGSRLLQAPSDRGGVLGRRREAGVSLPPDEELAGREIVALEELQREGEVLSPVLLGEDVGVGRDDRPLLVGDGARNGGDEGGQRLAEPGRSFERSRFAGLNAVGEEQGKLALVGPLDEAFTPMKPLECPLDQRLRRHRGNPGAFLMR